MNIYTEHPTIYDPQALDLDHTNPPRHISYPVPVPLSDPQPVSSVSLQALRVIRPANHARAACDTDRPARPALPATLPPLLHRPTTRRLARRRGRRRRGARSGARSGALLRAGREGGRGRHDRVCVIPGAAGSRDRGRDGAGLDVDAAEEEVLGGVGVAVARQLEDAEVPVRAVGGGGAADGGDGQGEGGGARGVPEGDGVGGEVLENG